MLGHIWEGSQQLVRRKNQEGLCLYSHNERAELLQLAWIGELGGGEAGVRLRVQKYREYLYTKLTL